MTLRGADRGNIMMDEVKMTLSIKSSSKLLSDAHAAPPTGARNGCPLARVSLVSPKGRTRLWSADVKLVRRLPLVSCLAPVLDTIHRSPM